jgi:hypothetical protein
MPVAITPWLAKFCGRLGLVSAIAKEESSPTHGFLKKSFATELAILGIIRGALDWSPFTGFPREIS